MIPIKSGLPDLIVKKLISETSEIDTIYASGSGTLDGNDVIKTVARLQNASAAARFT